MYFLFCVLIGFIGVLVYVYKFYGLKYGIIFLFKVIVVLIVIVIVFIGVIIFFLIFYV